MAAVGGTEVVDPDTVCAPVPAAGLDGVAPLVRPSLAGTRYVVAEIVAVIWGKPWGLAPKLIPLRVMRRPLTETRLLVATTKRSSRPKKLARWKKLPWKLNVKG